MYLVIFKLRDAYKCFNMLLNVIYTSNSMYHAIRLSRNILIEAQKYARIEHRSVPKQIEYWSRVGKIAQDNPDLTYSMIKDILVSLEEVNNQDVSRYEFD